MFDGFYPIVIKGFGPRLFVDQRFLRGYPFVIKGLRPRFFIDNRFIRVHCREFSSTKRTKIPFHVDPFTTFRAKAFFHTGTSFPYTQADFFISIISNSFQSCKNFAMRL